MNTSEKPSVQGCQELDDLEVHDMGQPEGDFEVFEVVTLQGIKREGYLIHSPFGVNPDCKSAEGDEGA